VGLIRNSFWSSSEVNYKICSIPVVLCGFVFLVYFFYLRPALFVVPSSSLYFHAANSASKTVHDIRHEEAEKHVYGCGSART
jgi:hypothetical protein